MLPFRHGPLWIEDKILAVNPRLLFRAKIEVEGHVILKNSKAIRYKWGPSRSGSNSWGKKRIPFIGKTEKQSGLMDSLVLALQSRAHELHGAKPLSDPLWALFYFVYPKKEYFTKRGLRSKNLPDLSNLYEGPQDALTKAGIIEDDYLIQAHDGSRILPGKKRELIIELYPLEQSIWQEPTSS